MKKTIVTLTGYTCSGKSYLLEHLASTGLFKKTPTFTTRPPREGEIKDVDYFFIDEYQLKQIQASGFVELVKYGNYYYGMSKFYLDTVLKEDGIVTIICTPEGVAAYEKYCKENDIVLVKAFVHTEEKVRLERLMKRIYSGIKNDPSDDNMKKVIFENINRCRNTYVVEQNWFGMNKWDVILSGQETISSLSSFILLTKKIEQMHEGMI